MANLLIDNVDASASDEDILQLLERYGLPPCDTIERLGGDNRRPAVLLRYHDLPAAALRANQDRLHGLFWKNHQLNVAVLDSHEEGGAPR